MTPTPVPADGAGEVRPFWAARLEDAKNRVVGRVLDRAGFEPRLQPYDGYGSLTQVRILGKVLYGRAGTGADHHDQPVQDMRGLAVRGFRNFLGQPMAHHAVEIDLPTVSGVETVTVVADRSGIIDATLPAELEPGIHEIRMRSAHPSAAPKGSHQTQRPALRDNTVTTTITVIDDSQQRLGVVSDIDDTVMVTLLPRPLLAAWNAFVVQQTARRVVPGMPVLYQLLRRTYSISQGDDRGPGAGSVPGIGATTPGTRLPFVYLSTGAWNVAPVLARFLFKNGYPVGPLLLTDWGPTNTGFFRSGSQHKRRSLASLAEMFPTMQWILIGDDGQHDPETYSHFVATHPDHVKAVLIRELSTDQHQLAEGGRHPLRAVGAAGRSLLSLIPKLPHPSAMRTQIRDDAQDGADHADDQQRAEDHHTLHGTSEVAAEARAAEDAGDGRSPDAQPTDEARGVLAERRIPWISSATGFGLVTRLRDRGLLPDGRTEK
ncbi:App1 family protein [Helcobacillus massiliensis]|uniref:App1 family protein n=1 Tax=Helcobacillus massiliensis TaxID=521392 RepID=UPI002555D602|nr:phosphatase domain-containing protein [Helcobacillus massiliensis]MDK7742412.1 DUF2183 domain-containing protein [Helcobacillus massiliensis]WOO92501.1 phosphatase domain-containing protein [Helcobacillus massiliensis]